MGEMAKQEPFSNIASQEPASGVVEHTKDVVSGQIQSGAQRSAGQLGDIANALRHSSQDLDGRPAAKVVNKAADQIDRVAEYVRTADVDEMRRSIESFARREPLLFLGGAFAAGMIGARFLKSSARRT